MNHRSRPDLPPQWRPSPHRLPLQIKAQSPFLPVVLDPRGSLFSPPESPSPTFPSPTFAGEDPALGHSRRPPSGELQEIEDEEYATRPYNPYNLPPASLIAVEVGSQSQTHPSLSRVSEREDLDDPVVPQDEEYDVTESQATTISTFFSPDLDARLPRTPDSDDNAGKRGRPVVQKRIASRDGGGVVRSTTRTTRVSPMTTPTKSRFSRDTRDRESHETSFACAGAKAVTNPPKRRNLASLLGIKSKDANKGAPKTLPMNDENMMDLDVDSGLDLLKRFKKSAWGDAASDAGSWDEKIFAGGGGREDRGSGEGENNGPWTEYLQTVGDTMTIASADFIMPRAAPPPPNPSLPTIPTVPSLSPLPLDHSVSVVTSTPRTKERAKKRARRTGRILSTGFPSPPMEIHTVPTTTFGLGLEGIEMELAMAMDTDFMDLESHRDVDILDADGDVDMDQLTDATPTMTMKTTITNGTTKDRGRNLQPTAADLQRQQQPTPSDSIVRLSPTSLALKTPFNGPSRPARPTTTGGNPSGAATMTKPLPLPRERQLLLNRTLSPRTPLSGSKPPVQKLMGKMMLSLPSVSTSVITPRQAQWNEPSPATPTQQLLSPVSPSPTASPQETPCPPERLALAKKPPQPTRTAGKPVHVPKAVKKKEERVVGGAMPVTKGLSVNGKRVGTAHEVQMCAQIDQCIAATDGMEETLRSCSYFDSTPFTTICDLLKASLVEMMGTIARGAESSLGDDGSVLSVAVTQDFLQWEQKHELWEQSIQKNVLKYYQLVEHTCSKPPRISRMEERMDKLVAYLRKFRDLNIRILASYDKLRVLLLSDKLATAVALVRANSASNSKRRHEDTSASMSISTNQRPKQRQRPSATGQVEPSTSAEDATIRRRVNSSTTKTTRNQIAPSRVTRKTTNQMTTNTMTRSTSTNESTADMFTARSRYTHVSKGVQAQTRGTHENTHDMLSPPLTRSNSNTRTSNDTHTRSRPRVHTNPMMGRTNSNPRTKANSTLKSKALSSLENLV